MVVKNDDGTSTTLQLNIWDAAGEADVHHLAHLFLKDAINSKLSSLVTLCNAAYINTVQISCPAIQCIRQIY